jgi:hypothetical protein
MSGKKQESQNQPPEDNRTADDVTVGERCAVPRETYNNIAVIASASTKTNCEIQIEVLREWTELKKLENECAQSQAQRNQG